MTAAAEAQPRSPRARQLGHQSSFARSLSPGAAGGRLNFTLTERSVLVQPFPKAVEARKFVKENYSPDPLGLRGPSWNPSVAPCKSTGKHGHEQADERLSNTLRPEHINCLDFRTSRATFQPGPSAPAEFNRGTHEWGITAHTWNPSTIKDTPEQADRRSSAATAHACAAAHRTSMRITQHTARESLVQAQTRRMADMRQQKADSNVDYEALEEQYGPDGASHMAHIIKMKRDKEARTAGFVMPPRRHVTRPIIPKQDLQDVENLPCSDEEA